MPDSNQATIEQLLESVFRKRYARSAYAGGREDYYGVAVTRTVEGPSSFTLHVTFRSAHRYCCMERGCHFGLWQQKDWHAFRQDLQEAGVGITAPLMIRLRVKIQEGALFGLRFPGDTRELWTSPAMCYEAGPYFESDPTDRRSN